VELIEVLVEVYAEDSDADDYGSLEVCLVFTGGDLHCTSIRN
jgi:hypothetical protein